MNWNVAVSCGSGTSEQAAYLECVQLPPHGLGRSLCIFLAALLYRQCHIPVFLYPFCALYLCLGDNLVLDRRRNHIVYEDGPPLQLELRSKIPDDQYIISVLAPRLEGP